MERAKVWMGLVPKWILGQVAFLYDDFPLFFANHMQWRIFSSMIQDHYVDPIWYLFVWISWRVHQGFSLP